MGDTFGRDVHLPAGAAMAAAAVVHPHPSMGGDRHHPLVVALTERLAAAGVATVRLDLRDPDPAAAVGPLEAAVAELGAEAATDRLLLAGYSWGAAVAAMAAPEGLVARALVAPPAAMVPMARPDDRPALLLVPAHDQYGPPEAITDAVAGWPAATVEVVEGCDHFLVGAVARIAERATAWLVTQA